MTLLGKIKVALCFFGNFFLRVKSKHFEMSVYKVVMVRHGESAWNKENRFCGWFDADLAQSGVEEAISAGKVSPDF